MSDDPPEPTAEELAEIRKRLDAECPHPRGSEGWKAWWREVHESTARMFNDEDDWPHNLP